MFITINKGCGLFGNSLKIEVIRKKYFVIESLKILEINQIPIKKKVSSITQK